VDIVLGVSVAPDAVRIVLVEGQGAGGVIVDQSDFDVPPGAAAVATADRVVDAILGTRQGAAEGPAIGGADHTTRCAAPGAAVGCAGSRAEPDSRAAVAAALPQRWRLRRWRLASSPLGARDPDPLARSRTGGGH
jgi:hypothetical protein